MHNLYCMVINLKGWDERLANTAAQLAEIGLAFTRIEAVNGKELSLPMPGVDPDVYRRCHGKELRLGEVGCYLSHIKAMEQFLACDCEFALILEDDIRFAKDALSVIRSLTAPDAPKDWDVVKLEGHHKGLPLRLRPLTHGYSLSAMAMRATGSAAYLVNRRAAEIYVRELLPMKVPYDHAFDRGWALRLRIRTVSPYCVMAGGLGSAIENVPSVRVKWWQKPTVLLWRARTEIQRVLSAVGAYGLALASRSSPARGS